jgi:hypothetical protein
MAVRLVYAFDPDALQDPQPPFVEDLIELMTQGHQLALTEIIKMVADLKANGRSSRYLKKLEGYPLWELKSRSRGGEKGGARVYLFIGPDSSFYLCHAEWKTDHEADERLLEDTAYMALAFKEGKSLVSTERMNHETSASKRQNKKSG